MMSLIQEENKNTAGQRGFIGNDLSIPPTARFATTMSSAHDPAGRELLEPQRRSSQPHGTQWILPTMVQNVKSLGMKPSGDTQM